MIMTLIPVTVTTTCIQTSPHTALSSSHTHTESTYVTPLLSIENISPHSHTESPTLHQDIMTRITAVNTHVNSKGKWVRKVFKFGIQVINQWIDGMGQSVPIDIGTLHGEN
jgi:hypothetical protein